MNSFFLIQRSRSVLVDNFLDAMGSFEVLLLLLAVRGVSSSNSSVSYPFCANFIFLRNFYSNYAILIFLRNFRACSKINASVGSSIHTKFLTI